MSSSQDEPAFKVFVGGLDQGVDSEGLKKEFEDFGATKADVLIDRATGRSRGFGFVWFASRAGMQDAIKGRHETKIKDRTISVKESIPEADIPPAGRQRDRYRPAHNPGYRSPYHERDYRGYDRRGGGYAAPPAAYGRDYYGRDYYGYDGGYGAAYDSRAAAGYDSRAAAGYDRSAYAAAASPYGGGGYDARSGYSSGGGGYGYGPERSSRAAPRAGPYDRR